MLAISAGEPAGIGPDLIVRLAQQPRACDWLVFADAAMLEARARLLGVALTVTHTPTRAGGRLHVRDVPLAVAAEPGVLDVRNADGVVAALELAARACLEGECSALVTGPVQKSVIADSGRAFSGHTEFLRDHAGVDDVLMLLVARELRVALVTTHLPLREVADAITQPLIERKLELLIDGLARHFGIDNARIAVAGLNPHAGEGGHLGGEERAIIEPACMRLRARGARITGPLPADTLFVPAQRAAYDAVLAMYHDQGLPVLKASGFGEAVNVTLGLPYLRTSVDHGTALDLAGTLRADPGSLEQALRLAGAPHSALPPT